ncbi:aldo/keto reductase [Bacillus subtilis]|uniref:aldo/keto reductase n=1 Tax=Bacillus subtilis TaxID=1423 RepID=UPI002545EC55|nr:aldo/keto reductase [Bacillus subtilis]
MLALLRGSSAYHLIPNEEIVGEAIKNRRQDLILATKGGNRFEKGKSGWDWDPSKAYIKEAVKQSLKRLQTDYIDLYQLHGGTIDDPIDETIEAFEELVEEGVIRYYGISSIRPNVIKEYAKKSNIVSVMMQYSLLDRRPEEWFSLLEEQGISVVARGPLAKGLLTEKPLSEASDSIQKNGYLHYSFDELKQVIPSLKKVAHDLSLTELSIQYLLKNSVVSSVVFGSCHSWLAAFGRRNGITLIHWHSMYLRRCLYCAASKGIKEKKMSLLIGASSL